MPLAHQAPVNGRGAAGVGPGGGAGRGRGPAVKRQPWNENFNNDYLKNGENVGNLVPAAPLQRGPVPSAPQRTPSGPGLGALGGGRAPLPAAGGRLAPPAAPVVSEAFNETIAKCQQHIYVGDRLRDRHSGRLGVAMYIGPADFARGNTVVGLRLDTKRTTTDCDGKFKGERYFRCTPGHGLYIPFEDAEVIDAADAPVVGAPPPAAGGAPGHGGGPPVRAQPSGGGGGAGGNPNAKADAGVELPPAESIADLEKEVAALVGLSEVKEMLVSLRNSVEVQRRRAHLGVREERVLHMLFLGNPGTGKTKVAKLVARMMRALGVLQTGQLVEVTRKDLIGPHHGETAQLTSDAVKRALGGVLFIDEAYALKHEGSSDSGGQEAINTLVKEIEDHQNEVVVILAGYQREMSAFLSSNSGLQSRFPHVFTFSDYSPDEMAQILRGMVKERGFVLERKLEEEEGRLTALVQALVKGTEAAKGNGRMVRNVVERAIKRQTDRVFRLGTVSRERLVTLTEADFHEQQQTERSMSDVLARLDDVIGLDDAKAFMRSLAAQLQVKMERKEAGLPAGGEQSLHMLFVGNPGTGKTTMARMVASLLKALGMLRLGHVIETDRGSLVAGYAGQTAIKTRGVVESALGGVLIVDEAYALVEDSKDSFGREALDTLVKLLEDNRDDIVAILAGYPHEMKQLMQVNPGLASRFPTTVTFHDYSAAQLMAIADKMLAEEQLVLADSARAKLMSLFAKVASANDKAGGNARAVRNALEQAKRQQAMRLVSIPGKKSAETLVLLTSDDVPGA